MHRSLAAGFAGLALLAVLPGIPSAQIERPHIKSGLWDNTMDMGGMKVGVQMCLDESVESQAAAYRPPSPGGRQPDCTQKDFKKIPGGIAMDTTCTTNGRVTHMAMTMTGDFQDNYRMDMTMQQDGAPERKMAMTAHYVGACPAGMKPGQPVVKMDTGAMAAAIAAARAQRGGGQ